MSTIEAEVRQAQQEAHKAAQKAEQAQGRLSAAQQAAEAARDARVKAWAEQCLVTYDDDVRVALAAIREAQQAFYGAVIEDLPAAPGHYRAWLTARTKLTLRFQDQHVALTELENPKTGMAAMNLHNPVPSFEPSFAKALDEAVYLGTQAALGEAGAEHDREMEELRRAS